MAWRAILADVQQRVGPWRRMLRSEAFRRRARVTGATGTRGDRLPVYEPEPTSVCERWEDQQGDGATRGDSMAQRTKADRQAAAKKGVATKQRKAADKSAADAKRSAKPAGDAVTSAARSLGDAAKQAGKSVASRLGALRKGR
jgi:hypothetical protein